MLTDKTKISDFEIHLPVNLLVNIQNTRPIWYFFNRKVVSRNTLTATYLLSERTQRRPNSKSEHRKRV
jgi:hypothetical protein